MISMNVIRRIISSPTCVMANRTLRATPDGSFPVQEFPQLAWLDEGNGREEADGVRRRGRKRSAPIQSSPFVYKVGGCR